MLKIKYWAKALKLSVNLIFVGCLPVRSGGKPTVNETPILLFSPSRPHPFFLLLAVGNKDVVVIAFNYAWHQRSI